MDYIGAALIVIVFIVLLKLLRLVDNSLTSVKISKSALVDIRNPDLSDDQKEENIQRYAIQLLKYFVTLTASAVLALGIPVGLIWLLDYTEFLSFSHVIEITLSVWFLFLSTIVIAGFFWLTAKSKK